MLYDDDSNPIDISKIPMPKLCLNCNKKDDQYEEILCNLNRFDQQDTEEFICYAYEDIYGALNDDLIQSN